MGMAVFMVSSTLQRARLCVLELVRPSCVQKLKAVQIKNRGVWYGMMVGAVHPKVDRIFSK